MLNVFSLSNGRLFQEEIESLEELARFRPIWVDLEEPTLEEKRWVKQYYGLSIPEDAIDDDIEESARFYEEDNGELHIRSDFLLIDTDDEARQVRVAFILNSANDQLRSHGVLFSIHDETVPAFRLLRMRARRMPGLLGELKILFPNKHAIYMHDTPQKALFDRDERAFSHGCVRLQDPRGMAAAVLGKSRDYVAEKLAKGHSSEKVTRKIPVYVAYFTAWPTPAGAVQYFNDVYDRDSHLKTALELTDQARMQGS